jgi:DNA-binding IclR family transcriptional regulator
MHWRLSGSVCISGPASRLPQEKLETLAQMLLTTAQQLSYALAGTTGAPGTAPVRTSHWHP